MERFDFPFHELTWSYPKGTSFKFGGGYEFSAAPQDPLQRTFKLSYKAMIWERAANGTYDATIAPTTNILALIRFFERHRTHKAFIYPHPIDGDVIVKFSADVTFETPKAAKGSGATDAFEITLVEQPL